MNGMRVLIAEDNLVMADVIRFNLKRAGFDVMVAANGLQAKELLTENRFDLLLTDYQMPHVSGEELCEYARSLPGYEKIPFLMCSAKALELDHFKMAEQLGVVRIIKKPFSPTDIVRTVSEVLQPVAAS